MTGRIVLTGVITAALAAAVGCGSNDPGTPARGEAALRRAAVTLHRAPARALRLIENSGPVAGEEHLRHRLWLEALEASGAPPARWRRLLAARPEAEAAAAARRALAAALRQRGDGGGADAVLLQAMDGGDAGAAEALLDRGAAPAAARAARWLAVHAPARLRRRDRTLERRILGRLTPRERMARARAWLAGGRAAMAARELGRLRWRGAMERRRRRLLAECEIAAGRPSRALRLLGRMAGAETDLLRARALRARAWQRFPGRRARRDFVQALAPAERAAKDAATRLRALELILECATEAGRLDAAWSAWRRLEALGWHGHRREWLGRRLGVALARSGAEGPVRALAAALPAHRRCLTYWLARRRGDREALRRLAAGPTADLYAVWAARRLGTSPPVVTPAPPMLGGAEPAAVTRWTAAGREDLALELWWRAASSRGLAPAEALALARREASRRRWHRVIRALRWGFPALRRGRLDLVPRTAVELYLPLRWRTEIEAAAAQSGLPPWLLAGQVRQESLFLPRARSPRGARGLLQLLPATARGHARALGLGPRPDLEDPAVNLRLGARELARLRRVLGNLELALAAYNGGLPRVRRWQHTTRDPELLVEFMPVPEMYTYVRRVVFLANAYRGIYAPWQDPSRRAARNERLPARMNSSAENP